MYDHNHFGFFLIYYLKKKTKKLHNDFCIVLDKENPVSGQELVKASHIDRVWK